MRVAYIAKHDSGGNQDEEAVVHAFQQLGHTVHCIPEEFGYKVVDQKVDLVLFNKWHDLDSLKRLRGKCPVVFWYWDLVDWRGDVTLHSRCTQRMQWMRDIIPLVDIGFCTDGDWAQRYNIYASEPKLVWLTQGADERIAGRGQGRPDGMKREDMPTNLQGPEILMTGIYKGGGVGRMSFVQWMRENYGDRFTLVEKGLHGEHLKETIARTEIVVAPDSPLTSRYWSNRVYLMLGFGAFLLHPYCEGLIGQYSDSGLVYYSDRHHLRLMIDHYMNRPEERHRIASAGLRTTLFRHTYRHRVDELLRVVRQRMK